MRELLSAARKLAGCEHPADTRFKITLALTAAPEPVGAVWCGACGTIFESRPLGIAVLAQPALVDEVTGEARELDTNAANIAHAEAHGPGAARHRYDFAREDLRKCLELLNLIRAVPELQGENEQKEHPLLLSARRRYGLAALEYVEAEKGYSASLAKGEGSERA